MNMIEVKNPTKQLGEVPHSQSGCLTEWAWQRFTNQNSKQEHWNDL